MGMFLTLFGAVSLTYSLMMVIGKLDGWKK